MTSETRRGLICHDEVAVQRALGVIFQRCGYEVAGVVPSALDAVVAAETLRPDAAVVDAALTGELGLNVVAALMAAAPGCAVVVLSPFAGLRRHARAAGAVGLVDPRDLRHVEDWLRLGSDPHHPAA